MSSMFIWCTFPDALISDATLDITYLRLPDDSYCHDARRRNVAAFNQLDYP